MYHHMHPTSYTTSDMSQNLCKTLCNKCYTTIVAQQSITVKPYSIFYNLYSPFLTKKCGSSIRNGINRTHQQNNNFLF